ncbi:hypothetical protein FHS78_000669 [Parvibaculum indicum]|uniref:hypothetical protein n=1 Tax=Parvibaculum indicum TaxID=562969 RepID=UPI0014244F96|nr:hypothetical protein [Parvibaculum indicum]NIJ40399.1 hypothetical protein [Parvibaculum indicum]
MVETPEEIVSDEEIERVHGYANFGDMTKRRVVDEGVLKYALGYTSGHTQLCILVKHGLVRKPQIGSYKSTLTRKGQLYLRSLFGPASIDSILNELKDGKRLDFLDSMNAALNKKYGTTYRWKLIVNHDVIRLMLGRLVVDLHDSEANGLPSCRGAIDEVMRDLDIRRPAARQGDGS